MLRRDIRKRKEYLYMKNKQALEKATMERKTLLRTCLEEGKPIPVELHGCEAEQRKLMMYDDSRATDANGLDNEYRWAGVYDPRIVVTTSRKPSSRLKIFAKEIRLIIPNSQKINRGDMMLEDIVKSCTAAEYSDLILLHETRGNPDCMIVSHLPYGPTAFFTLSNVVMRHDVPNVETMSEAFPHLIFHNFTRPLGKRTMDILKYLFPVPKQDSKRVISFINNSDYISFRNHVFASSPDSRDCQLQEIGPRFEMKLFRIILGTVCQSEADSEWELRPYMNTARKRMFIGEKDERFQLDNM
ncbi:U3 small nucleolar ribonucleoprotein IMP4 [Thelohanellus kitauei]|uniref:U3 small nucleolar ribonucleoprotein IMP4 n=1 Tax=Thelohanellus kitauei TaxID=669202 RepID=A0A0C2MX59_THEKT|nr:U3 small nucleolar ribonucleoprotein IMP4 [Thelohanellus kitauei]